MSPFKAFGALWGLFERRELACQDWMEPVPEAWDPEPEEVEVFVGPVRTVLQPEWAGSAGVEVWAEVIGVWEEATEEAL